MKSAARSLAKLIADSMLGDVARKLRLYGLDVLYYKNGDDEGLLRNYTCRLLLTCDEDLYKRAASLGRKVLLLRVDEDRAKAVAEVLRAVGAQPRIRAVRCTLCNGELRRASAADLVNVPEKVKAVHSSFYVCSRCGKVYWIGKHWKGITGFNEKVKAAFYNK